jgi:hypothetical protein
MRCIIPLIALLASGCRSAPPTITLPDGSIAYPIKCRVLTDCEQDAQRICKRIDYFVHTTTEHRPTLVDGQPEDWKAGASSVGEVQTAVSKRQIDDSLENRPWWTLVVQCTPPQSEGKSSIDTGADEIEIAAENARRRAAYLEAVCAVRDPELRRSELLIARELHADFSCEPKSTN